MVDRLVGEQVDQLFGAIATDHAFGVAIYLLVLTALVFVVYVRVIGTRGGIA